MKIITQLFKNEYIKIADNVINNISIKYKWIIYNAMLSNHYSLEIMHIIKLAVKEFYEVLIKKLDATFLNSKYRKDNFYKSKTVPRTIITTFGELSFERIYYVDKKKKNGFFFIDELLMFEKYKTYDLSIRAALIDNMVNTNANNTAIRTNFILGNHIDYLNGDTNLSVSRQTIYNWLKEWNIPKIEYDFIDNDSKSLYVMVDEKWIHEQIRKSTLSDDEKEKKHYIMSKCFITFTGAETKNNRTKLLNRHVFITSSDKPWKEFMEEIYYIYNYENFENIYLLSDAGAWILANANELKLFKQNKVVINTCEFHVKQYVNRMTRKKEYREKIIKTIYDDNDKKEFIKIADEIIDSAKNKDKKRKYKEYILKHWKTIRNMKDRDVKSSMESHISHCIAATFGSRPKGYSRKRIEKYLKLQEYKENGINIMDLYLKSHDKSEGEYVYNKEEVSYSIFENDTSNIPVKSSGNPIGHVLNSIAHSY